MTATTISSQIEVDSIFQNNWKIYQIVLRENYNNHISLYEPLSKYLESRFPDCFSILDLGCGDVDYLSKVLKEKNIWSRVSEYTGVDLSEEAMKIGKQNVAEATKQETKISFITDDMLNFVKNTPSGTYDFVFSSLAIHHLQEKEKQQLIYEIGRIIKPNGTLMIIDIFLDEDENISKFKQDIAEHIRNDWVKLNHEQIGDVLHHMQKFDFPEKLSTYINWVASNSLYADIKCLANLRFYKTIVLEIN